jgi:hypothetical protein
MWKNLFFNDLSGLETSFPQLGHLAVSTVQVYGIIPYCKECQSLEDVLEQLDTTGYQNCSPCDACRREHMDAKL